jgi:hypothetical protein
MRDDQEQPAVGRRRMLKLGLLAGLAAPALGAGALQGLVVRRGRRFPTVTAGSVLTAQAWNQLVEAVNELRDQPR